MTGIELEIGWRLLGAVFLFVLFVAAVVRRDEEIEEPEEETAGGWRPPDAHDDAVEMRLLERLERDGLLRDDLTAYEARTALDA